VLLSTMDEHRQTLRDVSGSLALLAKYKISPLFPGT